MKFYKKNNSSYQKYVPIELLTVTIPVSCRMIPFRSGSCPSKLERVKANSIEIAKIIDNYHIPAV
jgi:hypothetical protein